MKYFFDCLPEVKDKIGRAGGLILMLDFDGVLSSIAKTPEKAFLSNITKNNVQKCAKIFPTAIISGRNLEDIRKKINLPEVVLAGSHGAEWQWGKRVYKEKMPARIDQLIAKAEKSLALLCRKYPGTILEKKNFSTAVHYRNLKKNIKKEFVKQAIKEINNFMRGKLSLLKGKEVLELLYNAQNKGNFAKFFVKENWMKIQRFLPVYVGDDVTDEDAFKALKQGITIRVRKKQKSFAKYYLEDQKEIDKLLKFFNSIFIAKRPK